MEDSNGGKYRGIDPAKDNTLWTTDEDGAICKLKKDGKTWAEIATSINRTKNLVQNRFKYIKAQIEAAGCDTDSIGENWAEDMRRHGKDLPSPEKPSPSKASAAKVLLPSEQLPPDQASAHQPSSAASQVSPSRRSYRSRSSAASTTPGKGSPLFFDLSVVDDCIQEMEDTVKQPVHARGGGGGGKKHNKKTPTSAPAGRSMNRNVKLLGKIVKQNEKRFAELVDTSSSSSEEDSPSSEEVFDHEADREEQKRFLYHEYWSEMYPDQKLYEADKCWTEGDCKVLAVIEAKDEALKYKRMQADFFNATGRMISEEVIKYKMQHGN